MSSPSRQSLAPVPNLGKRPNMDCFFPTNAVANWCNKCCCALGGGARHQSPLRHRASPGSSHSTPGFSRVCRMRDMGPFFQWSQPDLPNNRSGSRSPRTPRARARAAVVVCPFSRCSRQGPMSCILAARVRRRRLATSFHGLATPRARARAQPDAKQRTAHQRESATATCANAAGSPARRGRMPRRISVAGWPATPPNSASWTNFRPPPSCGTWTWAGRPRPSGLRALFSTLPS